MPTLNFDILGRDRGATKLLKDVGTQAAATRTGFNAMQKAAAGAGMTVEQAAKRMAAAEMKAADTAGRLRVAQTQLADVRKKGTASASQLARAEENVSKAERQLVAAQKDVKISADGVKKATAEEAKALQQLSKDSGKAHDSINDLSNRAGLLGAGLLAGVGVVLKSAAGFDKAMSSVAATGADASKNIEALRKEAIAMGAATKFSATEAAQGIENLLKAGVSTQDVLSGGLSGALSLAAAGSMEVADAAEIAATAMTQFGLSGAQIPHVADLLAAGAGKAQGEVKDIGDALKMAGLVANQFGVSIEETTGTLAAFASAGLLGSDAGTSFKQMLLQLGAPSGKAAGLMEELGIAAYDANGNFVGLADLAGQLHDKLGPLTQAQRDNALATIFGSDAVRAANVLFKQGSDGINDWTKKVNEAGFAAQVARTKMDNLAGDLETLKGSIETTFIVAGTGANEALRGLTQEATRAVNAIGNLPAPLLETGVKLTALGGIGLLAVAGIGKLTIGVSESRKALADLGENAPRAARGLNLLGKAAAASTAAVVGLQVWGAFSNELHGKFTPSVDAAAGALLKLGMAGDRADLDQVFSVGDAVNEINGVGEALQRASDPKWYDRLGSGIEKLTGTTQNALTQTRLNFEAADKAITSLSTDQAAASFSRLREQAEASGVPVEKLVELFPQYASKVRDAANSTGQTVTSSKQLADLMSNGVPPAALSSAKALAKTANSTRVMKSEAKQAKQQLSDMIEEMFAAARAALELEGSEDGLEAAIDDATKAAKDNGKTLDKHTEKGRNNRAALRGMAEASIAYREKLIEQGASQKKVTNTTQDARQEFIKTAIKMGATREEARKLADKFGLLDKKIDSVDGQTVKIRFQANTSWKDSSGVKWHVNLSAPSSVGRKAQGGFIDGPGTETSDSIPTMLSKGEFVVRASETKKHRQMLEAINSGRGMAKGGYVRLNMDTHGLAPADRAPGNIMRIRDQYARGFGERIAKDMAKWIVPAFEAGFTGAAGGRVRYKGGTFTKLFARNLELVERAAHTSMRIFQGGFRPRTSYSGTSHAGDAVDFQVNYGLGRMFRKYVGAAGDRTGLGNWSPHIHAVPSPRTGRAGGSAIWQYRDYVRRGGARQSMRSPWGLSQGGTMMGPSLIGVAESGPERVLTAAQTKSFDRMVRVMDRNGAASSTTIIINAPNYVGSQDDLRRTLVDMSRRGQLEVIKR